jgi:hypothetical protein
MCQGENGWDIKDSLRYIINSNKLDFTLEEKAISEIVLAALEENPKMQEEHFRVY